MPDTRTLPSGYRLHSFDTVDSTNAEALRRIAAGASGGEVIWARQQTGGRGRRGRSWSSAPGNLYVTFVVPRPSGAAVGQLAFVAALGAGEAVRGLLAIPAMLAYKWPNDLLLGGRKLGGILIEASPEGDAGLAAVGLGLNVASCPSGMQAASLRKVGVEITVEALLQAVCRSFDRWHRTWLQDGFSPIRQRWLAAACGLGAPVEVRFPDQTIREGLFRGIDETGALLLEHPDETTETIATGEVFFATA